MTPPTGAKKQDAAPESSGRVFKILSHPLRQRILSALHEMQEGSPTQLADRLSERVGNVSYHVKVLADAEAIELIRTVPRRGALEHFYRPIEHAHISSIPLHLDADGHRAVAALLSQTVGRLLAIDAEVKSRVASADGNLTPTEVAILHHQRAPDQRR